MTKHICIHSHFYQPPRENPWTGRVLPQETAFPYHDWNERITSECYKPNLRVKMNDQILNIYTKISFNFGPTLLAWLERNAPDVYSGILTADKIASEYFSGHGPAIAQAYNHTILPLMNGRDKITQVLWGIRDFEERFRRTPEGFWLPEQAVDTQTLEVLAEQKIKFTILSPHQAKRFRKIGETNWINCSERNINPYRPYLIYLPSSRSITIFFRHTGLSDEVSFGNLLQNGETFAQRLLNSFQGSEDELLSIATDGETYGHHHKFGEIALGYCINFIEKNGGAKLTIFGEYLEKHPPLYEVDIEDNTSWSCPHGLKRWSDDCSCTTGEDAGFSHKWRKHLWDAMKFLKSEVDKIYEIESTRLFKDPWDARNDYIYIILKQNKKTLDRFFASNAARSLNTNAKKTALKLLKMQYYSMLSFTSCGWFFDDISRIETRQILTYALRTMELAKEIAGVDLEREFLKLLKRAESNYKNLKDGAWIYKRFVKPLSPQDQHLGSNIKLVQKSIKGHPIVKDLPGRWSGILLPIFSLPSDYGIGDLGPTAYRFVDILKNSKQRCWQILPLNPVSPKYFYSPYKSLSSFAGNPLYLSPELLVDDSLLRKDQLPNAQESNRRVDYEHVWQMKSQLLEIAYERFKKNKILCNEFEEFCEQNSEWLDLFAIFITLSERSKKSWREWDEDIRKRKRSALMRIERDFREDIEKIKFIQFLFFRQWFKLKNYANERGIKIIGDLPFYVSFDSLEVWKNPEIFKLNKDLRPKYVSGVPPDYFSPKGQLWGDPVYNWNELSKTDFNWWIERIKYTTKIFDILRLDHFRGFVAYWEIPGEENSAVNGKWVKVPAYEFFDTLLKQLPESNLIAEDLGTITEDVVEVRRHYNLPGMKVLQFAFDEKFPDNPHLPHLYDKQSVSYTGTHDNNTILGWFLEEAGALEKMRIAKYLNKTVSPEEFHLEMLRLLLSSPAGIVILPFQDLLGLGSEARINKPSIAHGNWNWRVQKEELKDEIFLTLSELTALFGRSS